jgi:hypothetical protein
VAAGDAAGEEPVPPAHRHTAHRSLTAIVV